MAVGAAAPHRPVQTCSPVPTDNDCLERDAAPDSASQLLAASRIPSCTELSDQISAVNRLSQPIRGWQIAGEVRKAAIRDHNEPGQSDDRPVLLDTGSLRRLPADHVAMAAVSAESSKVSSRTGPPDNNFRLLRMKLAGLFPEWLT